IDLQRQRRAAGGMLEGDGHRIFDIRRRGRGGWLRPAAHPAIGPATDTAGAEDLFEDILESRATTEVLDAHAAARPARTGASASAGCPPEGLKRVDRRAARAGTTRADAGMAELVIVLPLLGVGEDVV